MQPDYSKKYTNTHQTMVTINTTFHVDEEIKHDFIDYMKSTYIAEAVTDNKLVNAKLSRIHAQHVEGGISYSVQFAFNCLDDLDNWDKSKGLKLNEELIKKFQDKVAGFSTLLEEIEL